jgi:polysaccharide export outer membrane protein
MSTMLSFRRFAMVTCLMAISVMAVAQTRMESAVTPTPTTTGQKTLPMQPVTEQSQQSSPPAQASTSTLSQPEEMLIGPGDLLEISVFGAPESVKTVRVSSDGTVTYPFVGSVHLANMTVRQAESAMAKKLQDGGYYNNPNVSILVKEYATQGISVLGEVQKPGIYPLMGPRQLFDAISAAGGLTPKAGRTVTIIRRGHPSQPEIVPLTSDNDPAHNPAIYPGDTVSVSKAGIVYVVGNVNMPGGYVMENPDLSILQAVALAQGVKANSSANNSKLIRKVSGGQQEIPIKLNDILASKAPDVKLKPDDILFVPSSPGASAAKRGLEAALQTLTGLAIYRRP